MLVVPSGENTTRMLLAMSNASNRKNNFIKMQDWVDIIEQIHRQYNQVLSANSKRTKAQVKTALLNFKMDISEQFDIKMAQLGQWFQVAKVAGDMWDKLLMVMKGDYDPGEDEQTPSGKRGKKEKKSNRFKSGSYLLSWVSLPEDGKMKLVDYVLEGELKGKEVEGAAKLMKARMRLRKELVDIMKVSSDTGKDLLKPSTETAAVYEKKRDKWYSDHAVLVHPQLDGLEAEPEQYHVMLAEFPFVEQLVQNWASSIMKLKLNEDLPGALMEAFKKDLAFREKNGKNIKVCFVYRRF